MTAIPENRKFITTDELKNLGYSYYKMRKLVDQGVMKRVNRTTYENLKYRGEENDFYTAEAFAPEGVVCLLSAARYYDLTTYIPKQVDVAIERKKKVSTLPEWPELSIHYFNPVRMDIGVCEIIEEGNVFHIFDIEKTVVDIVCYRNKVGIEETAEILKNYLARQDRHIDRLYEYSKNFAVKRH